METPRITPVLPVSLPAKAAGSKLAALLGQREFLVRGLLISNGLILALLVLLVLLLVLVVRQGVQIVALDGARNVFIAPGAALASAKDLHVECSLLITTVLLSRNPRGFDLPEFLPQLFSRRTRDLAEQLQRGEQTDFEQRQLRQKPEVARIEALGAQPSSVEVRVFGQLVRTGSFGGQAVAETVPFTLRLTLERNPDLLRAPRFPVIVTAFTLRYEASQP